LRKLYLKTGILKPLKIWSGYAVTNTADMRQSSQGGIMTTSAHCRYYRPSGFQPRTYTPIEKRLYDELQSWFWLAVVISMAGGFGKLLFLLLQQELSIT
jgi:hypothetical protein